ncbi:MAG: hypothetical protein QXU18_02605 [Thermoplasmatales archaeon]
MLKIEWANTSISDHIDTRDGNSTIDSFDVRIRKHTQVREWESVEATVTWKVQEEGHTVS